jgi:hypothetical protein
LILQTQWYETDEADVSVVGKGNFPREKKLERNSENSRTGICLRGNKEFLSREKKLGEFWKNFPH